MLLFNFEGRELSCILWYYVSDSFNFDLLLKLMAKFWQEVILFISLLKINFYFILFFRISFQINFDRFNAMWPKLCVLARSKPSDKFTLVKGMMESTVKPAGEVVAVTGSGANDGPVLRMADVGFTMVISKTY